MGEELTPRYVLEIESSEKSMRISKSLRDQLKGAISAKMIRRMKKELVLCPIVQEQVSFLKCYSCKNFMHRIKGSVGCKGEG